MASLPKLSRRKLFTYIVLGVLVPCLLMTLFTLRPNGTTLRLSATVTPAQYLDMYNRTCRVNAHRNVTKAMPLCSCIPDRLVGWTDVGVLHPEIQNERSFPPSSEADDNIQRLAILKADSHPAGRWRPQDCVARQSVAIIVPFHDREEHLKIFLSHMHPFLQRQQLDYAILIIEQDSPEVFNRAALLNIGYAEANRVRDGGFDCYIFHDVDLLPEDDRNFYTCFLAPLHLGAYMNKFTYQMPYDGFFGGAIALSGEQMRAINGFSNSFYGWGGEDDDALNRVRWKNLKVRRYPPVIGRSFMIRHDPDHNNPVNPRRNDGYKISHEGFMKNGLSSLKYKRQKFIEQPSHTRIVVSIDPEWDPLCIVDHTRLPLATGNYVNCLKEDYYRLGRATCCRYKGHVFCCQNPGDSSDTLVLAVVLGAMVTTILSLVYYCYKRYRRRK